MDSSVSAKDEIWFRVPSHFKRGLDTADYPAGIRNGDLLNRGCCTKAGLP
jgi:hypothetical protein